MFLTVTSRLDRLLRDLFCRHQGTASVVECRLVLTLMLYICELYLKHVIDFTV